MIFDMPSDYGKHAQLLIGRRAKLQTTIPFPLANNSSVIDLQNGLPQRAAFTAESTAGNTRIPNGSIFIDLDGDADRSIRTLTRQPTLDLGLRARLKKPSFDPSNRALRNRSPNAKILIKRKAETEEAHHTSFRDGVYRLDYRPYRCKKTELTRDIRTYSVSRGSENSTTHSDISSTNIQVTGPDPDANLDNISTAESYGNHADVIELDGGSDEDESASELQVTGVQRTRKKRKLVIVPRILDTSKKGIHVKRIVGPDLQPGTVVEFRDDTFMKIQKIYEDSKEGHLLIGYMYSRAQTAGPEMPYQRDGLQWKQTTTSSEPDTRLPLSYKGGELINEVIQKIRTITGEKATEYGLWRRSVKEVMRVRHLRVTNQHYNDINCVTTKHVAAANNATVEKVEKTGDLHCRWKDSTIHDRYGNEQEQRLERPTNDECDRDWISGTEQLRETWRGSTPPLRYDSDPILFCDAYCGAGGVSSGAQQAGLTIALSFDKESSKIATFSANFPDCQSLVVTASQFVELAQKHGWRVDVLHLSPPCQPFSANNTTPNEEKNERNQTPLLTCSNILEALRPRIVTVEETPGISSRHRAWFCALLHQFTDLGFSLRWSNIKCSDFGVPQLRRRLFIIAAAPGEKLPPFPCPTHAPGTVSIATVLHELERANRASPLSHHDTSTLFPTPKPCFDPHTLAKTITCGGGSGNYYPDGSRQYTVREFAALQTFALRYLFGKTKNGKYLNVTELREQIGNAVPPLVAKAVLSSVVKSLRESDKRRLVDMRAKELRSVIVLDG